MNKTLCLIAGLIALPSFSLLSGAEKTFPAKEPVLSYELPEGWKSEVDAKDGSLGISSADGRIAVNFAAVEVEASMETFSQLLPAMVKTLKEPMETEKPKEHAEDGLTGYTATYVAKIEGKPAMCMFILFNGGKNQSVLGSIVMTDPETLPAGDTDAIGAFMKSVKGVARQGLLGSAVTSAMKAAASSSFPATNPVITYVTPEKWKSQVDAKGGAVTLESADGRVAVNMTEVPAPASLELFQKMLPEMVKSLKDAKEVKKPEEHTDQGLTGFSTTYTATIEDKPALCIFILFKSAGANSVVTSVILGEPTTLSKDDQEAVDKIMNSIHGVK